MVICEKSRTFAIDKRNNNNQLSPKRITDKRNIMRKGFYECNKHNPKNRKKAIEEMPYASILVDVIGGYMGFESWDDYEIWKNQK